MLLAREIFGRRYVRCGAAVLASLLVCLPLGGCSQSTSTGSNRPVVPEAAPANSLKTKLDAFAIAFPGLGDARLFRDRAVANRVDALNAESGNRIRKPTGSATAGQFPWMVSIEVQQPLDESWVHYCGGTLIAPGLVLSAGHCNEFPARYLRVVANQVDLTKVQEVDRIAVDKVDVHPQFDSVKLRLPDGSFFNGLVNDVALFRLASSGPKSSDAARQGLQGIPLTLDAQKKDSVARGIGMTLGWGVTDTGKSSPQLLFVNLPLVDDSVCGKTYSPIDASMLCAGFHNGGSDSCEGDSGGPLIVRNANGLLEQVGVVSFGKGCGEPGHYGIYAWISAVRPWIDAQMKEAASKAPSQ